MKYFASVSCVLRGVLVGCALAATAAVADPMVCGDKPVRLAFYEFGLFYYTDAQGVKGIDKDIVDELTRRSGCKFETQVMARARIWADLASGDLDMSVSGIQNPERDNFAWFAHYLTMKNFALVQAKVAASAPNAHSFLKQAKWQFGAVRSFKHGLEQDKWLDELRASGRVEDSADVATLFKKLKEGRIDAMFSQPAVFRKYIPELGLQKDIVVQDWTPQEKGVPHGLILAKSRFSETQARQWQSLVDAMRKDGTLKRIYAQYVSPAEVAALLIH